MNKKTIVISFAAGLMFVNGMFASDPKIENLDINTIEYIEDEMDFDLGFDTADYLPEDFDASQIYFNLESVQYVEDELVFEINTKDYLPVGFDAYAFPSDVQSINYIDEKDSFEVRLNSMKFMRSAFNSNTELSK